jgi:hypothetical protein
MRLKCIIAESLLDKDAPSPRVRTVKLVRQTSLDFSDLFKLLQLSRGPAAAWSSDQD